ncbi:signal peptide peptidase SppA [Bacillus taeanensis]|uniref:Signal peptide peptidase SppA n=1 Tax=Bacillus taeanensis TaxID=273032 RepID=A0A366Y5G9_9BACI|nr:signal peptide peptidase SppA [Bacillus taeanensis]RBW71461.1 signal peptide peptidase SppA [Bacillus taeanensis]
MNGKRWAALGIAAVLFIVSIFVNLASSIAFGNLEGFQENWLASEEEFAEKVVEEGNSLKSIVVLNVDGVIQDAPESTSFFQTPGYNHRQFLKMLEKAGESGNVEGIIIRVNSPGGGVVESAEIHDEIIDIQKNYKKPVYISMGNVAASGGYYISTPAEKIYAHPATMTGSLGVIMQTLNYSELAENFGVKWETIKSGPHKDIGSPTREMTDEERKILQSMVDNSYEEFVEVIANGRELTEEKVKQIADGRIYDGRQAKQLKLVDELGDLEDTIAAMKKDLNNKELKVIRYEPNYGIGSWLEMTSQKLLNPNNDLLGIHELVNQPNAPRLMYLYTE